MMAWLTFTRAALKILSGLMGIVAAVLWFISASGKIPLAPGAEIGGTLPTDPFNVALRHSARLNQWAAGATGVSVLLMVLAEWSSFRIKRDVDVRLIADKTTPCERESGIEPLARGRANLDRRSGTNCVRQDDGS
jgi:hypothetical protein